ncbi:hypothetical protein XJ20_21990 [Serratia liquefaciens]|nr:hypothetical protein XJ20_21990 [Serratia liquefaciens]
MPGRIKAIPGEQIAVLLLPLPGRHFGKIDAPQKVFNPHHQLTQLQWFGHIVIRSHLQPYNPINLIATPSNENNADV